MARVAGMKSGCGDQVRFEFEPPLDAADSHTFVVVADGEVLTCEWRPGRDGPASECPGPLDVVASSGRNQPLEISVIHLYDRTPAVVSIEVTTNDEPTVIYPEFEPVYEQLEPNGPECEPICQIAMIEL